jgi:antitoxin CcdA
MRMVVFEAVRTAGYGSTVGGGGMAGEGVGRRGSGGAKRATNVSVRGDLLHAARGAGVNLSALLERALSEELVHRNRLQWRAENLRAIAAYNEHLLRHGTCRRSF